MTQLFASLSPFASFAFSCFAIVLILVLARRLTTSLGLTRIEDHPFRRKQYLLSRAERSFYEVLRLVVGTEMHIFPKVRLLDLLYLPHGTANRIAHMNRVQSKHVDFVLCDVASVSPVLVIELDDASHERLDRARRDEFVDATLRSAGLPILRVEARRAYAPAELAALIKESIGHVVPVPRPADVPVVR